MSHARLRRRFAFDLVVAERKVEPDVGHLARDGREDGIRLLDTLNGRAVDVRGRNSCGGAPTVGFTVGFTA